MHLQAAFARTALGIATSAILIATTWSNASAQLCPASTPVLCPAGSCAATARDCAAVEGCPPNAPHRCANGACAQTDAACTTAAPPVEAGAAAPVAPGEVPPAAAGNVQGLVSDSAPEPLATEIATEDDVADVAAEDNALESRQSNASDAAGCPDDAPVDCADGTCASSIYACSTTAARAAATPAPALLATDQPVDAETGTEEVADPSEEDVALTRDALAREDAESAGCTWSPAARTAGVSAIGGGTIALTLIALRRLRRRNVGPRPRLGPPRPRHA